MQFQTNPFLKQSFELAGNVQEEFLKPEQTLSPAELKLFSALDNFGEVVQSILTDIYKRITPQDFNHDRLVFQCELQAREELRSVLTNKQQEMLDAIFQQINKDHQILQAWIKKKTRSEILDEVSKYVFQNIPNQKLDQNKIRFISVPAGIAVLFYDQYYQEVIKDSSLGLYLNTKSQGNKFSQRTLLIDADRDDFQGTFRHEFLHLLITYYIENYEIPPFISQQVQEKRIIINSLEEELINLAEEFEFVQDADDWILIQQEIARIRSYRDYLEKQIEDEVHQTPFYYSRQASSYFRSIRNELSASALSLDLKTILQDIVSKDVALNNQKDKEKILKQWDALKIKIEEVLEAGFSEPDLLPVFITSQNFDQMTKRLGLLSSKKE